MIEVVAVVQAAIYDAVNEKAEHPVSVFTLPVPTWKKHSVGKGNATKAEVMQWANAHGYEGNHQDAADAWCIAHAGRALLTEGGL